MKTIYKVFQVEKQFIPSQPYSQVIHLRDVVGYVNREFETEKEAEELIAKLVSKVSAIEFTIIKIYR